MSPLGRGLASLIPKRKQAEEAVEEDLMESIEMFDDEDGDMFMAAETQEAEVVAEDEDGGTVAVRHESVSVDVEAVDDEEPVESTEETEEAEEELQMQKPKVTLLSFDQIEGDSEEEVQPDSQPEESAEEAEEEDLFALEFDDEEEAEAPSVQEAAPGVFVSENTTQITMQDVEVEADESDAGVGEDVEVVQPEEAELEEETTEEPIVAPPKPAEEEFQAPGFGEAGASDIWNQHEEKVAQIALGDIRINPLQPRKTFADAELDELRDSIGRHGILQPLVVRRLPEGEDVAYELIAGERRLRAAKSLGWDKVPCVVRRDVRSDQSRLVYALIENIQRQNLNPMEEALAYEQLNKEYGLTHEEIGERVGKSRVAVTNALRMLQLPTEIQRGLSEGKISVGHAKAILMIPDKEKQIRFYRHLVEEGVTVRKAEIRARRIQRSMKVDDPTRIKLRGKHPLALRYSPSLEERYGYNARIKFNQEKNRFDVFFEAHSEKDLEELVGKLLGTVELVDEDRDLIEE